MLATKLMMILFPLVGAAMSISVSVEPNWGEIDGKKVQKFTIKNANKQEVDIITYGATVTAIRTPDKNGHVEDVALGFDKIADYQVNENRPYFGATVGRVANRIGRGRFTIDGVEYSVSKNVGNNTLHGGAVNWSHKLWEPSVQADGVVMSLVSEDGDQGFPGAVLASVVFRLSDSGELTIEMKAASTKKTVVNLTNHSYFNLAGHGTNAAELYKHEVEINADRWTVTDAESIPTGELRSVDKSIFDLRQKTCLGQVINQVPIGGYDYNFCLPEPVDHQVKFVARVVHPGSGRKLEVFSNQPGVQFYTANFLPDPEKGAGLTGKGGKVYYKHGAFCLETQNYPDAMNHENFPSSILQPNDQYYHAVTYKFSVQQ